MAKPATLVTLVTVGAIVVTLLLRAVDHSAWYGAFVVALALLGGRLIIDCRAALRRTLPWSRLLVPSIVWLEAIAWAVGLPWQVRLATVGVLEIALVVVGVGALLRPDASVAEVRIARALEHVVPPAIARLAAIEMVIVGMALRFLAGGWRRTDPPGFTYHRESGLRMMLPILPLLAFGDFALIELLVLPHAAFWVRAVIHAFAVYGLVWLVGIYASLRARPHVIDDGRLALHRGVLRSRAVALADVVSIAPLPAFRDDWKRRAYLRGAVRLDIAGASALELRLVDGTRLIVGADDPTAFVEAVAPTRRAA